MESRCGRTPNSPKRQVEVQLKSYGQIAYEAYLKYSDGKSLVSGATLPRWEDLAGNIRDAWLAAAQAVVEQKDKEIADVAQ